MRCFMFFLRYRSGLRCKTILKRKYQDSIFSFTFTMSLESFLRTKCDIVMSFFSLKSVEIAHSKRSSIWKNDLYFWVQKSEKSLIFCFHIVIYFQVNSYKSFCLFFDHSSDNMLKWFEIFAMHTNEKRTLRCLKNDTQFLSWETDCKSLQSDTKILKKLSYYLFMHNDNIRNNIAQDYIKNGKKRNFFFERICKSLFFW